MQAPQSLPLSEKLEARSSARAAAASERSPRARAAPHEADATRAPGPRIWAVGGGKGGVGKSVITSNLAVAFARRGERCVVLDADLGGANLHTMLGVESTPHTLADFLSGEVPRLADVVCPTPVPNLGLISGARALLDMANPRHSQKEKLLRHISGLDVEHVLLDLSAGSAFNVLDFFVAADHGILVIVPEPTSIENAYHFLKAAFYRSLRRAARRSEVRVAIERALAQRVKRNVHSARELIAEVAEIDADAGALLERQARRFAPMLVVNQAQSAEHRQVGRDIQLACLDYLGTDVRYLGALDHDERVPDAVGRRRPVLQLEPGCPFSRGLNALADRLLSQPCRERDAEPEPTAEDPELHLRRQRALYAEPTLATRGLLSEDERQLRLRRIDTAYRMVFRGVPRAGAQPPPLDVSQPGLYLKRCRQRLGLDFAQLAARTRIRCLDSIERERFDELPGEPHLRHFVLQYARELGIVDGEALAESFVRRWRAHTQPCRNLL